MKFSRTTKTALVSALLLGSGAIAMTAAQDDGAQLDPAVPLDDAGDADSSGATDDSSRPTPAFAAPQVGANETLSMAVAPQLDASSGGCGFGSDDSCMDDDHVLVGVWLCEDMENCGCNSFLGCDYAKAHREYVLDVTDYGDNQCDTLGGWRDTDEGFSGAYGQWYTGAHVEVHPADWWKLQYDPWNGDPDDGYAGFVKVQATHGEYCTGAKVWDTPLSAWDDDNDQPGDWEFDAFEIKSLRPYIDFENMVGDVGDYNRMDGVGFKMTVWPNRHMAHPYDMTRTDECPLA